MSALEERNLFFSQLPELLHQPSGIYDEQLVSTINALSEEANRHHQQGWQAHMTPTLAPYSLLGQQLAAHHQGNLLSPELFPLLKQAEQELLSWFKRAFNLSSARFGHGGTYNNLEALWQAREASHPKLRTIYGSEACHYSISKACRLLGLDFVTLPVNHHDQLDIEALRLACQQQRPLAIVLNAGTTTMGSSDDLDSAITLAKHYDAWIHVDASWGGASLMLSNTVNLAGIDTLCFDPHKSLFQPRPCSLLLSNHPARTECETDYLEQPPYEQVGGSYGAELFLPLWLNWKMLGESWFQEKTLFRLNEAEQFVNELQSVGWSAEHHGTGIVCFGDKSASLSSLIELGVVSKLRQRDSELNYRAVFASYLPQSAQLIQQVWGAI